MIDSSESSESSKASASVGRLSCYFTRIIPGGGISYLGFHIVHHEGLVRVDWFNLFFTIPFDDE